MNELESSTMMTLVSSDKSDAAKNSNNFSKLNNFIKIKSTNTIDDQLATTSQGTTNFSFVFHPNH